MCSFLLILQQRKESETFVFLNPRSYDSQRLSPTPAIPKTPTTSPGARVEQVDACFRAASLETKGLLRCITFAWWLNKVKHNCDFNQTGFGCSVTSAHNKYMLKGAVGLSTFKIMVKDFRSTRTIKQSSMRNQCCLMHCLSEKMKVNEELMEIVAQLFFFFNS